MKKYLVFLGLATICGIISFFIPIANIGMFLSFISICFLFGRSFSEKKEVIKQEKHIYELEHERADSSLLSMGLVTCTLIFAGISLKSFFFVWSIVSMNDTLRIENLHVLFLTFVVVVTPIFCGYYLARLVNALISFRFKIRID